MGAARKAAQHKKPNSRDIAACRPWLEAELGLIRPAIVVALGATAAQTLLGPAFRVTRQRGEVFEPAPGRRVLATVHPSSLLRLPGSADREAEYRRFVGDLRAAWSALD